MKVIKIVGYFVLVLFIVSGSFYLGLIEGIRNLIVGINSEFMAYLSPEQRTFMIAFIFAFVLLLGFSFT